ncbi:MAG: DEAD/DEAH box helicase [Byssovorax sp.]
MFTPLVDAWFTGRFGAPTPVQARAFPAIATGADALIAAPTGSGKTLAAFLTCLDRLVRTAALGGLEDRVSVLYVSPLKALSNDVQKNLDQPIAELSALAEAQGLARLPIRTAVRTGDSSAADRRELVKKPPHVLVTTPESLYILLTSVSGRRALERVGTIILDEIHAVAPDKRGAHLALSVERLEALVLAAGNPRPQRIGLSATMRPIEVAAKLLVGASGTPPVLVDAGQRRDLDLAIEVPRDELGAVATNEQWAELYDRLAALVKEHRSTLIFVNTRRLVERLAHHLGERLGEEHVAAHHGSLSRARRFEAERRLKSGELKVVIATASLELGIDVGTVDLACILGSPRSIAAALQRIGRSGHALSATPKGRFFPLTRDQLIESAAIVRASRRGVMDAIALRKAPLDVLAQQIIATAAAEESDTDALYSLVRKAASYGDLDRETFDRVVEMVSEGVSTRRGREGALVHHDAVNRRLRGRRGSRLAALTSGGAIPDNANYDVMLTSDATKVGTVDEDFAIDSSAGDVFLLGNTSWRIHRVEPGKVWVEDAHGAAPTIPFWFGEAPARTIELSTEIGNLRKDIVERYSAERKGDAEPGSTIAWLKDACALDDAGARLACEYVAAGHAVLGAVPTLDTIVAERFFDEAGGTQLILHAPFGGRINRALGLCLRKRFCRSFDFELQAAATDDGVLLSLGPQHSFPLESLLELLRVQDLEDVLTQAALQSPMFGTRFRWDATRSLTLLRFRGGKKVPPALQRMRSDDLMAAVFPAAQGCQDNHGGLMAHIDVPDHPLVNETVRDCLEEVMDVHGLRDVLNKLHAGEIRFLGCETPEPSVFSHEILNANPYAFLDDAPLEERRARAVSVRRGLPAEIVERVGGLPADVIESVVREAEPEVRSADELHDLLLDLGAIPEPMGIAAGWEGYFDRLLGDRRVARSIDEGGSAPLWISAERCSYGEAIWPTRRFSPALTAPPGSKGSRPIALEDALAEVVRGHLRLCGPITAAALGRSLGVPEVDIGIALARIEVEGRVIRGRFSPGLPQGETEWCDRTLLARIHRITRDGLRKAIEPASPADLMRFLFRWQGVTGMKAAGRNGLHRVIEQLQGFEAAAGAWESEILPARLGRYEAGWLDDLCFSGEVCWGRLAPRESGQTPTRAAPITFARRRDLAWLLAPRGVEAEPPGEASLSDTARKVLAVLRRDGASFFEEIVGASGAGRAETDDALWELCAAGRITGDGFGSLRALLDRSGPRALGIGARVGRLRGASLRVASGRWALLRAPVPLDMDEGNKPSSPSLDEVLESLAKLYLRRYGVVFRDLLAREPRAPAWRDLVHVLRRMEMRGEIRGGRLVRPFVGEQFALPEALDALRAIRREGPTGEEVDLSACDPLNLVGITTPGARVPAHMGNRVRYRDGVPVLEEAERCEEASLPIRIV